MTYEAQIQSPQAGVCFFIMNSLGALILKGSCRPLKSSQCLLEAPFNGPSGVVAISQVVVQG